MMKISKTICIILLFSFICIATIVFYYLFEWKMPSSQEIYKNSQQFVVELKSQTGDDKISYGTAVFIDGDGTLVSNAHMVTYRQSGIYKEFESFEIRFSFEKEFRLLASLVKYDLVNDISILKLNDVDCANFKSASFGDSSKISPGDKVYAVGNGMNHGISITQGMVSLAEINIEYDDNVRKVIQCDLIINEGNSGGALLDERGRLIGITTFRLKDSSGNVIYGIAFSIAINDVINYYKTL